MFRTFIMESIPDAASSLLAYSQVKRRALSARCYRVKVPTSNGQTFNMGQTMNLDLAGNMNSAFYDVGQSYFKFTITNTGAASPADDAFLDGNSGAYALINRLQLITGGQTISDIQQFNVLASALMTQNVSHEWTSNVGPNLIGTAATGANAGINIVAGGAAVTVCLPFILTAVAGTTPSRYIPAFSRDALRFRFYLEALTTAFSGAAGAAPVIQISEPEAIMYIVELSPAAMGLVGAMTNNIYNILCADYRSSAGSFTGRGVPLTTIQTLGFSVSSLERVIITHRESANIGNIAANSIGARVQPTLNEFQLLLNGQSFPERPILFTGNPVAPGGVASVSGSETLAETLVAQHALSDFGHQSCLDSGAAGAAVPGKFVMNPSTGVGEANTGTFVCAIELESMAGKSNNLYSGISTIGSVCQFRGQYTAPGTALAPVAYDLNFFCQNTILLSLDMSPQGLGTYVVSV